MPIKLFGIGNPLLDIAANTGPEFLEKYGLKTANAILAAPEHLGIYEDMKANFKVEYTAGGATQNSIRVAQWMLGKARAGECAYSGCVGNDANSEILRSSAEKDGVKVLYQVKPEHPTGTCAVVIVHHERSLVANVAAAEKFTPDHLETPDMKKAIEEAQLYYSAGFFLLSSPDSAHAIAVHANEHGKKYAMNLAAPFLMDFFLPAIMKVFVLSDIVFGNETEARAFSKAHNFGTDDVEEIAKKTQALDGKKKDRIIVFTQGPLPCIVCLPDGTTRSFPGPPCPENELVDSNGAGDAFVGGFLSQFIDGKSIDECVRAGHWAAGVVIRRSGATFPDVCTFA